MGIGQRPFFTGNLWEAYVYIWLKYRNFSSYCSLSTARSSLIEMKHKQNEVHTDTRTYAHKHSCSNVTLSKFNVGINPFDSNYRSFFNNLNHTGIVLIHGYTIMDWFQYCTLNKECDIWMKRRFIQLCPKNKPSHWRFIGQFSIEPWDKQCKITTTTKTLFSI